MEKLSRIYVAGHRGLVGSAICRALDRQGYENLLLRTRAELDLTDPAGGQGPSSRTRNPTMFFWPRPRSGASSQTIPIPPTLFVKISRFKRM